MDAFRKVQGALTASGVAVGVVLAEQLTVLVRQWRALPGVVPILAVVVVACSIVSVKCLAENIFRNSKTLRRRLLGKQYVEGTWFDIMRRDGEPAEVGISWLTYTDSSEITYRGEDYDWPALKHRFPYEADAVHMKGMVLMYKYTAKRSDDQDLETTGYGELVFRPGNSGFPTAYTGAYFTLIGTHAKMAFEGYKLNEKQDSNEIELLNNPATRKEGLRLLLSKYG